ncbi:hypothetical protein [Streptomyces sp. CL12-4]|uniref:hypothetical protein n=1 Tax=Streptomyces sp. CL12-4 TaxID=2810306 RepID=UPI001EFA3D53|nr:hypothetical protein [Streptomyces sp. CL12-4]
MTHERPAAPLDQDACALASQVEGYLLLQAEREQARREAQALCACLPWLTTAQAEDLTNRYCEQRLHLARRTLEAVAARADQLRDEYETRYAALRHTLLKRHAACASLLLVCASTASTSSYLLSR